MRLFPTPRYVDVQELLDRPGEASAADLHTTLRDIRRANIFGLGTWVVKHHLTRLLAQFPKSQTVRVLDLATGSADIPEELCRWARAQGRVVSIVATDISPEILEVAEARIRAAGFEDLVTFAVCDATASPFPDASFDVVTCSLAFHHLQVCQAQMALLEMARLARVGFVINDIYRAQGAWLMAWVLTRLSTTNRLTRHDGPASVYRAFTPAEMRRLCVRVGLTAEVIRHPFWRMAMVWRADKG